LFDEIDALAQRRRDERDRDITLAWTMVNLAAATWSKGRVPDLAGLLTTSQAARPQSLAEQKAILQQLAQRLGRPLQIRKRPHGRADAPRERPPA